MSDTSVSSQIELLPDKIIQYVGTQGYSKTFISATDPLDDPNNNVAVGDYWLIKDAEQKWQAVKNNMTWGGVKESIWGMFAGYGGLYCLGSDRQWFRVYDSSEMVTAFTQITQTQDMIRQEAVRANAAEGRLESSITITADRITQEVSRANAAEGELSSRINVTADAITTEVTRATAAESGKIDKTNDYQTVNSIIQEAQNKADAAAVDAKNASIAKTSTYQSAESIVSVAVANVTSDNSTTEVFSTTKAYAVGDRVIYAGKLYRFKTAHPAGAWNSSHVDRIYAGDSKYIAQTTSYQTASSIVTEAVRQSGVNASTTYLAKTNDYQTVNSIIQEAQSLANTAATTAQNASIAKTSTYQSAEAIVSVAVANVTSDNASAEVFSTSKAYAIGDRVIYNGRLYQFKAAHSAGAWNSSHVNRIYAGDSKYIAQTTSYQTADAIYNAATTYTNNNAIAKTQTYQTAASIYTAATTYTNNNAIAKTETYQTADSIALKAAQTTDKDITAFSTSKSYAVGKRVLYNGATYEFTTAHSAGAWDSSHVTKIDSTDINYEKKSGITITASGIDISGSQYVKIASGGYFQVTTGNFGINSNAADYVIWSGASTASSALFWLKKDGSIKTTSGTIGGWNIGTNYIGNASTLNNSTIGLKSDSTGSVKAIWVGGKYNGTGSNTPKFYVDANGDVYIKSLKVRNETDTGWDTIDFTSFATQEDVEGGFDKLKYNTVKSISSDNKTITLSNGRSYNIG